MHVHWSQICFFFLFKANNSYLILYDQDKSYLISKSLLKFPLWAKLIFPTALKIGWQIPGQYGAIKIFPLNWLVVKFLKNKCFTEIEIYKTA